MSKLPNLITPGIYRTRGGDVAPIFYVEKDLAWGIPFGNSNVWLSSDGHFDAHSREHENDLIERIGDLPCSCGGKGEK